MDIPSTPVRTTLGPIAELDRLGDQIAELSAHLEAASARLPALIREFDARGGWGNGFRSCADWPPRLSATPGSPALTRPGLRP